MTVGYLMFAHNNPQIDYGLLALCNALMIKKNLKHNAVALVSDQGTMEWLKKKYSMDLINYAFDHIIYDEYANITKNSYDKRFNDTQYTSVQLPWYNYTRSSVYDLSPFHETILLDSDYLILDNTLDNIWNNSKSFMINKKIKLIDNNKPHNSEIRLDHMGIPLYWATLLYFKKDKTTKILFDCVEHIKDNYKFYQNLYNFKGKLFRNDYVFSIAVHIMNGFIEQDDVCFPNDTLLTSYDFNELLDIPNINELIFLMNNYQEHWKYTLSNIKNMNVHCMNKFSIIRNAAKIISQYGPE